MKWLKIDYLSTVVLLFTQSQKQQGIIHYFIKIIVVFIYLFIFVLACTYVRVHHTNIHMMMYYRLSNSPYLSVVLPRRACITLQRSMNMD